MLEDIHCLQTHALLLMDEGKLEAAIEMLSGGRMLADEMAEKGLACRFGVNLAVAHNLRGDGAAALQYADGAVAAAADRKDTHFQAVAAVARQRPRVSVLLASIALLWPKVRASATSGTT